MIREMKTVSDKKLKKGDRVRCAHTGDFGTVIGSRGDSLEVKFDNGAIGVCTAPQRVP